MSIAAGYELCREITKANAGNFYYGIRLLPRERRLALCCVYAFARRVDDVADGELPAEDKLRELERLRSALDALAASSESQLQALGDAASRYPIPLSSFHDLIDGAEQDVRGVDVETVDDLVAYCRRVAGSIGRLSLGIYGASHPEKQAKMADDLGVALQITNILRDVREDFRNNRIYLPAEDLTRFGIEFAPFGEPEPFPSEAMQARFATLVEFEAARAREWYGSGLRLLATIDRRSAACTGAMAGIYRRLLDRIAANPHAVLEGRMSLPGSEKALVAAEALAGLDRWKYRKGAGR
jgi:phytoene synthase